MDIKKMVSTILKIMPEEIKSAPVPDSDAIYFWDPKKGGMAVIINSAGEKLLATSGVSPQKHMEDFKAGCRN